MSTSSASDAPAGASAATAASVHFHPSARTLQESTSTSTRSDDEDADSSQPRSRRWKLAGGRGSARESNLAQSQSQAHGNNTATAPLGTKADRAAKSLGGKKARFTHSEDENRAQRRSQSRSPTGKSRTADGRHHDTPKRRPMRPVEDVLSRIRHELGSGGMDDSDSSDPNGPLGPFSVAYIDRVWGDQEVSFTEFFESEDTKDVPMHRISYIRYYDEIIWNRAARYDAVFGSSNSDKTLPDWIAEGPQLKEAQERRWALMLATEALEEEAEARMLAAKRLDIDAQRQEIEARQSRKEAAEAGGEDATMRDEDEEEEESEQQESTEDEEMAEAKPSDAVTAAVPATEPASGADGVSFDALPPRAAGRRRGGASASAVPAAPAAYSSSAALTSAPRPLCDDDANITVTVSLLDGAHSGLVLRSSRVRVSTAHFDFAFLRKRIARKLHVQGGWRQVKRLYLQRPSGDTTRITDDNFARVLSEGCQVLLMAESVPGAAAAAAAAAVPASSSSATAAAPAAAAAAASRPNAAAALLFQPKVGEEAKQDEAAIAQATRSGAATTVGTASASATPASSSSPSMASRVVASALSLVHAISSSIGGKGPSAPSSASSATASAGARGPSKNNSRPTHFVSLRINSPSLVENLRQIQTDLLSYEPRYEPFLVRPGTFHITLSLLCIQGEEDKAKAIRVFESLQPRMAQMLRADAAAAAASASSPSSSAPAPAPLSLTLHGVSSFRDAVVYADVARDEARAKLNPVAAMLADEFDEAGVGCTQNRRGAAPEGKEEKKKGKGAAAAGAGAAPSSSSSALDAPAPPVDSFVPHLTLAKMSRARSHGGGAKQPQPQPPAATSSNWRRADPPAPGSGAYAEDSSAPFRPPSTSVIRRIDSGSYRRWKDAPLGTQPIVSLDLCSMVDGKQADGYYGVIAQVQLQ